MSDPHARRSDPISSHIAVAAIAKDGTIKAYIIEAARSFTDPFNDTQLWEKVEQLSGKRQQRNVIARSRDLMEDDGIFVRVGMSNFRGRDLVDFVLAPEYRATPTTTLF